MALSKREFDHLRDRVSQLENKLRALELRTQNIEKRITPQELYRVIKGEEKAKEIEKSMGQVQLPGQVQEPSDQPA